MDNKRKDIFSYLLTLSEHNLVEVLNANFAVDAFVDEFGNLNFKLLGEHTKTVVIYECGADDLGPESWDEKLAQFLTALLLLTPETKINNFFDVINENTKPNN